MENLGWLTFICIVIFGGVDCFDCFQRDNGQGCQKWHKYNLKYHFSDPLHKDVQSQREELALELSHAFDAWANVSIFNFNETASKENADIIVSFEEESHGDCDKLNIRRRHNRCHFDFDGKLAHAYSPEHQARGLLSPLRGELHFNVNVNWTTGYFRGMVFFIISTIFSHGNFCLELLSKISK